MYDDRGDTVWGRLRDYLDTATRYIMLNLAWLLLTFPFAAVFFLILRYAFGIQESPWALIFIPITLASPAIGGLYYATNQLAHDIDGGLSAFWEGVKKYVWPSYRWGIMNLVMAFLFNVNIWFYGNATWSFAPYIRVVFIVGAVFWATVQMYTFPFIIEQEDPLLKTALRNSFIATARFPLRSFGFVFLVGIIVFVSTFLFVPLWALITVSLFAYLSNKHTLIILEKLREDEQKLKDQQKE